MIRASLGSGIVYLLFGGIFIYFAIYNVRTSGWSFLSWMLVIIATLDIGSAIRMILLHFRMKRQK